MLRQSWEEEEINLLRLQSTGITLPTGELLKMDLQTVTEIYRGVIDNLVQRVSRDFIKEGVDECDPPLRRSKMHYVCQALPNCISFSHDAANTPLETHVRICVRGFPGLSSALSPLHVQRLVVIKSCPVACRAVLDELRVLWEAKLAESGCFNPLPEPEAEYVCDP